MTDSMAPKTFRVLVVGSLPPPIGGTTVLLKGLVDALRERDDVEVEAINAIGVRSRGLGGVLGFVRLAWRVARAARRADIVSVHGATKGLHILAPTVVFLARLAGKPVIVRKFGGTDFRGYSWWRRRPILWALRRARLYLVETKMLVQAANELGLDRVRWYPNSRPATKVASGETADKRHSCRRFVFLGQLWRDKGIPEIIAAGERLSEREYVVVDIYGTLGFDVDEAEFAGLKKVRYCGALAPERVAERLCEYDVLLMPSYIKTEGYPGVIIEAYASGLPVICTDWQTLPEIVDERSGILVAPRDAEALFEAMTRLADDDELFARLRAGARERAGDFASEVWFCGILSRVVER
ncbi:glycosyltransferase [Candidatus Sumerlaeota bacterium]